MPYIESDTTQLFFEQIGEGPPVLLVAGMASDSASWRPVQRKLAEHFNVISLDNRCTGRTHPIPATNNIANMLGDMHALLDHLNIAKVALVGHSLGAMLSWRFANLHPHRVTALVAVSAGYKTTPARVSMFNALAALRTEKNELAWFEMFLHLIFSDSFFKNTELASQMAEMAASYPYKQTLEGFKTQVRGLEQFIELPNAFKVDTPSLAITGEYDLMFTPCDLENVYGHAPNVQTKVISNAGHSVHWENTPDTVSAIATFLKN